MVASQKEEVKERRKRLNPEASGGTCGVAV
jgi:hypothetical protein